MTDTTTGDDREWLQAAYDAAPAAPPLVRKAAPQPFKPSPFAEAVKQALANERARRGSDLATLRAEIAELRAELGVQRRLAATSPSASNASKPRARRCARYNYLLTFLCVS